MLTKKEVKHAKRAAKIARCQAEQAGWTSLANICKALDQALPIIVAGIAESKDQAIAHNKAYEARQTAEHEASERRESERHANSEKREQAKHEAYMAKYAVADRAEKAPANGAAAARAS